MALAEEIEEERQDRGIQRRIMAELVYDSSSSWTNVTGHGYISEEAAQRAQEVFDYYDEHGIVPLPEEVDRL